MDNELINQPLKLDSNADSAQQASYSQPSYKNLSSASNALDLAIGDFFNVCLEKYHDE